MVKEVNRGATVQNRCLYRCPTEGLGQRQRYKDIPLPFASFSPLMAIAPLPLGKGSDQTRLFSRWEKQRAFALTPR
jgi:hypothetical protein